MTAVSSRKSDEIFDSKVLRLGKRKCFSKKIGSPGVSNSCKLLNYMYEPREGGNGFSTLP